jgi:YegS/Rv2252/BmrU family lipid kinase
LRRRLIANPRAGRGSPALFQALASGGHPFGDTDVVVTTFPGEAALLARKAVEDDVDVVLVAGGDGTMNEVASALVGHGTALGVLPTGSGNGLARVLGIPLGLRDALRALGSAEVRLMDTGVLNGHPFVNVAGAGLDAAVGSAFQDRGASGGGRGLWPYFELGIRKAWAFEARRIRIETDAEVIESRALIVAFANGRQYGGGAVIAPGALLDDGILDLVLFEDASFLEALTQVPKLFYGGIESYAAYRHVPVRHAIIRAEDPLGSHRDGEPGDEAVILEVSVVSRALPVLVPKKTLRNPLGPFQAAPDGFPSREGLRYRQAMTGKRAWA